MPIGKNAIRRVENNGYSNVKSSAPDMENSSVVVPVGPAEAEGTKETLAEETVTAVPAKPTKKRGRPSKAAKAEPVSAAEEKPAKTERAPAKRAPRRAGKKAAVPAKPKTGKNGFERVEIGTEMPYWLL